MSTSSGFPKANFLQFPYGTNFKYNGLVHHQVDRLWVVAKLPIPNINQIKFPVAELNLNCEHIIAEESKILKIRYRDSDKPMHLANIKHMKEVCMTSQPLYKWLQKKEQQYQSIIENLIEKELLQLTPQVKMVSQRNKRFLGALIPTVAGLVSIAVEHINGYMQRKRDRAIKHSITALKNEYKHDHANIVKQFRDEMILCGKYNIQGLENIMNTVDSLNAKQSNLSSIVTGQYNNWQALYLYQKNGADLYAHHVQLYLHIVQSTHFELYSNLIEVLRSYLRSVSTLAQGFLPSEIFYPSRIATIVSQGVAVMQKRHPHYVPALTANTDYYDMPLVTFCVDNDNTFVVAFPVLVQPRANVPLTLFEIETVKVPVNDTNNAINSYTQVVINKPYIAATNLAYIQLRPTELRMCKKVASFYLCEEIFLLKYRNHHTCPSTLLYNTSQTSIMQHCKFQFFYNTTVLPSILDGGASLVLANYVSPKILECHTAYPQGFSLPDTTYVQVNRSILCHCDLTAGFTRIPSTISACDTNPSLTFTFTINLPFLHTISDLINKTILNTLPNYPTLHAYQIPYAIPATKIKTNMCMLQDYKKYIADQELKNDTLSSKQGQGKEKKKSNKQNTVVAPKRLSFLSRILRYVTIGAIIVGVALIFALCFITIKHFKLSLLVGGLLAVPPTEAMPIEFDELYDTTKVACQEPWLTFFVALISLLGVCIYIVNSCRSLTFFKGFKYNNEVSLYIIVGTNAHFVPIKIHTMNGNAHLFNMSATINISQLTLLKNNLWDLLQINWGNTKILKRNTEVQMPRCVHIPLMDKIKIRYIMSQSETMVYMMCKQGNTWSNITINNSQQGLPTSD